MPGYSYELGTTTLNMTNVESMTTPLPAPRSEFVEYMEGKPLGNGRIRGVGPPAAIWNFGYLTRAQRDQLRTYCTGASSVVYLKTRKNDNSDAYQTYSAIMVWPREDKYAGRRLDFVVNFIQLVEVAIP